MIFLKFRRKGIPGVLIGNIKAGHGSQRKRYGDIFGNFIGLKRSIPICIWETNKIYGSPGDGLIDLGSRHKGGDGTIREYRFLEPTTVHILSERRSTAPPGMNGGGDGKPGRNIIVKTDGTEIELPSKGSFPVKKGEILRIETPGGGGWGKE